MLTYKNILIAVDGSQEAEWAFNKAVEVAKRNNAKLIITNVIDSRTYTSYEVYDVQFTEKSKQFAEELLRGYKDFAQKEGVEDVETLLEFGSPKAIIPKKNRTRSQSRLSYLRYFWFECGRTLYRRICFRSYCSSFTL